MLNLAQLESDLKAKALQARTLLEATMITCQNAVVKAATATEPEVKGRLMTPEEKGAIEAVMVEGRALKAQLERVQGDANMAAEIAKLTEGMNAHGDSGGYGSRTTRAVLKSIGQQYVESSEYRAFIKAHGHRSGGQWSAPAVDVEYTPMQATLMDTSGASGGPLIIPEYLPGVVPILFRRLTVADLIASGDTDSNAIIYMKELAATNVAAATAQGAAKPESTITFVQATDPVVKIATFMSVTEELMEDYKAMASYLDARLRLFIGLAEEDQLLNGSGVAPNMVGLMQRAGLSGPQARGADTNIDALFKAITNLATLVFVQPDGFVMNPINWQAVQLLKNANGNYLGFGPWVNAQPPSLWGLPGAITPAIAAGTGLVGAFKTQAQFFRKGGLRVETSNSHSNYFQLNQIAVRAEERGALCVYRPAAFEQITGLA
jgi:HK97 family phage major capsid protein